MLKDAVGRKFEIIGEALAQLSRPFPMRKATLRRFSQYRYNALKVEGGSADTRFGA
jgi:uncharacterized protein with HEPN domain